MGKQEKVAEEVVSHVPGVTEENKSAWAKYFLFHYKWNALGFGAGVGFVMAALYLYALGSAGNN